MLDGDVILLLVPALVLEDLVQQVDLFGGLDVRRVLDGPVIVVLGGQGASEDHVAGERAADLDLDRFLGVVADPLGKQRVVVPAGDGAIDVDLVPGRVAAVLERVVEPYEVTDLVCARVAQIVRGGTSSGQ